MVTENKFSKYLLYAIGEIILVVIGILIALQINTSNENKQLEKTKHNYYNQLLTDLNKEITNINDNITYLNKSIKSYEEYQNKFTDSSDLGLFEVYQALASVNFGMKSITYNTNTIETLKSTGEIKLISTSIRNKLIELNRTQIYLTKIYDRNIDTYEKDFVKAREEGFDESTMMLMSQPKLEEIYEFNEIKELKLIIYLSSLCNFKYMSEDWLVDSLKNMIIDINNINEMIELELKITKG